MRVRSRFKYIGRQLRCGHGPGLHRKEARRNISLTQKLPFAHHRRAALLIEKLPHVSARPLEFLAPAPTAPLGSWTLIDRDTILAAPHCSNPFPNGEARFVEDRTGPPNRAYLKLCEALALLGERPEEGDTCLDLGASPGGWTWVLARTGARVRSIDKAPLDPAVAALPNVEYRSGSAFALEPGSFGQIDWLCCDVICYPERLLRLVRDWQDHARRMICTIKFQGETDQAAVQIVQGKDQAL